VSRNKKIVTTTLDNELHRLAKKKGVAWTDALEEGVKKLISLKGERKVIQKEIDVYQGRIIELQNRLNAIDQIEDEIGEIEVITLDSVMGKMTKIVDKGNLIDYHSVKHYAPKIGMMPEELRNIIESRLGNVIDNSRQETRSQKIEGVDGTW
jgi:hypothetical protein